MDVRAGAPRTGHLPARPPHRHFPAMHPTFAPMMHGFDAARVGVVSMQPISHMMFPGGPHFVHTSVAQPLPPPPPPPRPPPLISSSAIPHRLPHSPSHQHLHPVPASRVCFTQQDLDLVLYGYAGNKTSQPSGHALSGLRTTELSYGIDRILGRSTGQPHTKATLSAHIDPSTLDIPEGLEICQSRFTGTLHHGVFCTKDVIPKGTRFGPFRGRKVNTSEIKTFDDNSHMWEIFEDGRLSHFVDGRGSAGNWMAYVNCARHAQEQNLIVIQENDEIYYETCKDIPRNSELLVWYGDSYVQFMGIPVSLKDTIDGTSQDETETSEGFKCERCGKMFAYKYYRDKHLKYTRCVDQGDRKFPCHLCSRSFEKRDRLRIHILHVHERHRPHKCTVCDKSFSQSSSLNKHMRVHSGERPYKCVYCSKAFTASSILRTHIRQHSGEKPFKCTHCGKAFASHAAHDSHVRRTHTKERPCVCDVCGKTFAQPYELKFHMNMHAGEIRQYQCDDCGRGFTTPGSLAQHRLRFECRSDPGKGSYSSVHEHNHEEPGSFCLPNKYDVNMNLSQQDDNIDVVGVEGADPYLGLGVTRTEA